MSTEINKRFKPMIRSHVLNDDLIEHIFRYISVKHVIRLQSVSRQFNRCSARVLTNQSALRIGGSPKLVCGHKTHGRVVGDITDACVNVMTPTLSSVLTGGNVNCYDLIASEHQLSTIFQKCSRLTCLLLSETCVDVNAIQMIARYCKHLRCICFDRIYAPLDASSWQRMANIINCSQIRLTHLSFNARCTPFHVQNTRRSYNSLNVSHSHAKHFFSSPIDAFTRNMASLEKLVIRDYRKPMKHLLSHLPSTVRSVALLECHKLNAQSLMALVSSRDVSHVTELTVEMYIYERDSELDIFTTICDQFRRLKRFAFYCGKLSSHCVSKLAQLESLVSLKLDFSFNSYLNLANIGVNSFKCLRTLYIENNSFKPRMLAKFHQQFPNLLKLTLKSVNFYCQCRDVSELLLDNYELMNEEVCDRCYDKCVNSISKLSKLRSFLIHFDCDDIRQSLIESLASFKSISFVWFVWFPDDSALIDQLLRVCRQISSRDSVRVMTLKIDGQVVFDLCDSPKSSKFNIIRVT